MSGARDQLFERPEIAEAVRALREAVRKAAGCSPAGATYLIRDHYREQSDPRHPITRWP